MFALFGFCLSSRICESSKAFNGRQITTTMAAFGEPTIMQIRINFRHKLKYQSFAASGWQDHKHILTLAEIPEQVSNLKSPKIQNLLCILLCKPLSARSNSQPFTASFVFVALGCSMAVQPVKLNVKLFLLGKDWH